MAVRNREAAIGLRKLSNTSTVEDPNSIIQAMISRLTTSLWRLGVCLLVTTQTYGQVSICGNSPSSHPVDVKALYLRDSLRLKDIDTIVVYRHWLWKNGFNGYGKVVWVDQGQCFQYKIEFENNAGNYGIKQVIFSKINSDSPIDFFFANNLDTVTSNPTKQLIQASDDSEHFIEVSCKNKVYCYLISGLLVQFNPDHLRAKFVRLLSDKDVSNTIIDEKSIRPNLKRKRNKH